MAKEEMQKVKDYLKNIIQILIIARTGHMVNQHRLRLINNYYLLIFYFENMR